MARKRSQRRFEVDRISDFLIVNYKLGTSPIVLMWREAINAYRLSLSPDNPIWSRREERAIHEHWKRFGPPLLRLWKGKFTVVPVGDVIRELVAHGNPPNRDGVGQTDAAYRLCIPSTSNQTMGITVFPKGTQEDHPLILESNKQRCNRSASAVQNAADRVWQANDLGNLSDGERDGMIGATKVKVAAALEDRRYPLFAKIDPRPVAPLPSPEIPGTIVIDTRDPHV